MVDINVRIKDYNLNIFLGNISHILNLIKMLILLNLNLLLINTVGSNFKTLNNAFIGLTYLYVFTLLS